MIFYIAKTLGATARGVGILRQLGTGTLVTAWRDVATAENIPWFGGIPLAMPDDVLIYDGFEKSARFPTRRGRRIVVGETDFDADLVIITKEPILPRLVEELDLDRAAHWWKHPPGRRTRIQGVTVDIFEEPSPDKILAVRGGNRSQVKQFKKEIERTHPEARLVVPFFSFYWPAQELIAIADEVIGPGSQVKAEAGNGHGALEAAGLIREIL